MAQLGGTVSISGDYPAWEYRQDSSLPGPDDGDLLGAVRQCAADRGHPRGRGVRYPGGKLPGLDCVSMGPNLLDIHTPRERMDIASVQRVWRFVLEVLKRSK